MGTQAKSRTRSLKRASVYVRLTPRLCTGQWWMHSHFCRDCRVAVGQVLPFQGYSPIEIRNRFYRTQRLQLWFLEWTEGWLQDPALHLCPEHWGATRIRKILLVQILQQQFWVWPNIKELFRCSAVLWQLFPLFSIRCTRSPVPPCPQLVSAPPSSFSSSSPRFYLPQRGSATPGNLLLDTSFCLHTWTR